MNARERFTAIRRAYRIAQKVPFMSKGGYLYDGACGIKLATLHALRSFTGKWDNCEQVEGWRYASTCELRHTRNNRTPIYAPIVYQACTRFLRTH